MEGFADEFHLRVKAGTAPTKIHSSGTSISICSGATSTAIIGQISSNSAAKAICGLTKARRPIA